MDLRRILLTNTALALVITLIPLSFGLRANIWRAFVTSMVYSHVIGSLGYLVVPRVWRKYLRLPKPSKWLFRLSVLLAAAVVGTLISCFILLLFRFTRAVQFWPKYWIDLRLATLITLIAGTIISVYEGMRAQLEHSALAVVASIETSVSNSAGHMYDSLTPRAVAGSRPLGSEPIS